MPNALKEGTRVAAVIYGEERTGTVFVSWLGSATRPAIIWVMWDGSMRPQWMHRESLTVIEGA